MSYTEEHPTAKMRWFEYYASQPDEIGVTCLQQWWQEDTYERGQIVGCRGEWRDVPTVIEKPDGSNQ